MTHRYLECALLIVAMSSASTPAQCSLAWSELGGGTDGLVLTVLQLPNGDIVVGGDFTMAGTTAVDNIARWDGSTWSSLGPGLGGILAPAVHCLARLPNGDLVAGGRFALSGGENIARWDGSGWSPIGTGTNERVRTVTVMPNGDLVAGGFFTVAGGVPANRIARWNGVSWSPLGSGFTGSVLSLTPLPNGDVVAGGTFVFAPGSLTVNHITRWDGSTWHALGNGVLPTVWDAILLPDGDLVAAGNTVSSVDEFVWRWSGAAWAQVGGTFASPGSEIDAVAALPNGDILAGGEFVSAGGILASNMARWDGTAWSAIGAGVNDRIREIQPLADGRVAVGGHFTMAGGSSAQHIAILAPTCPATSASYGAPCAGGAGPNVLAATTLPWVGSTFRATTTGLGDNALAIGVFGFSPIASPMSAQHPLGQPGCNLLVTDEILIEFMVGVAAVDSDIEIPNNQSLVGGVFYHQVVPVEIDAAANITMVTGSNGLTLTIGAF